VTKSVAPHTSNEIQVWASSFTEHDVQSAGLGRKRDENAEQASRSLTGQDVPFAGLGRERDGNTERAPKFGLARLLNSDVRST
jgi:hypothetical protein